MKIIKTILGAVEVVGGAAVAVVGGTCEYAINVIGANCPDQSSSEWEESQNRLDTLDMSDMLLVKTGDKLLSKGIETFKAGMKKN